MKRTLRITCSKFEDRIKEDKLAKRRGWKGKYFGFDGKFYSEWEKCGQ